MSEQVPENRTPAGLPIDLATALDLAGFLPKFLSLPPSHRQEYVKWIEEAKKPETRKRRIEQTVVRLLGKAG